jgi:thiosulfate dehydrogenase [quinone] large subunit
MMEDPPITQWLFNSTYAAWGWLAVRLYVGYQWVVAGEHKVTDPAWMSTGEALKGFWVRAAAIPAAPAKPVVSFDWYRDFLQFLLDTQAYTWFAKLVAVGEVLIGIGLILGAFTGIAAFFGAFMNWNFMMAGTASTNPLLMVLAVGLMLAWKVAGFYGADRWILPLLGTPWHGGKLVHPEEYMDAPAVRTA